MGKKSYDVIPLPGSVTLKSGSFWLTSDTPLLEDASINGLVNVITFLTEKIESSTGILLRSKERSIQKAKAGVFFQLVDNAKTDHGEGYDISIEKKAVIISASSLPGLFYGAVTFFLIVYASYCVHGIGSKPAIKIRCGEISDEPHFPWRGLLLDCSRHFVSKEFVKMIIDVLALYKMNRLHWHLTDDQGWRLEIKSYPRLTETGSTRGKGKGRHAGYYTQSDVREIVKYAGSRFVEVVPEIEMPGHSVAALASYPELSCTGGPFEVETKWGIFEDVMCAGNENTYSFVRSVLDEVSGLFPSRYVHIGGDEVPDTRWKSCPECGKIMKENGLTKEAELESLFLRRACEHLTAKGKIPICWDEAASGAPIPNAIIQYWRAFEGKDILMRAIENGHKVIVSPASNCYFDYPTWQIDTKKALTLDPYSGGLSAEQKKQVIGVECNMWTEHASEKWIFAKILPRLAAVSEVGWLGPGKSDFGEFVSRLAPQKRLLESMGITMGEPAAPDFSNPPELKLQAKITTTMGIHSHFTPDRAFSKEKSSGIYWTGRGVNKGESFTLILKKPLHCNFISVATQCADVADNTLEAGVLEASTDGISFESIAEFRDGIAEASFDTQKIKAVRITATEAQEGWVAISDICVEER